MKPPSVVLRALLALALLLGFYVVTLVTAALLFALPPFVVFGGKEIKIGIYTLFIFAFGWIPAGSLLYGAFSVRRPKFASRGKLLSRSEAPALFAMLDEIGAAARTAPPSEVYLEFQPQMGVLETGGTLGFGTKRVLLLGAPYLESVTVQELRAILAHELGHFVGGDTRLRGLLGYTEAAFRSVISASERDAFRSGSSHAAIELGFAAAQAIGTGIVRAYARLYFLLTRPMARRQELAADALSAAVAGRDAAIRALEGTRTLVRFYRLYLDVEVCQAVAAGGMPTDLLDGFGMFRARFAKSDAARAIDREVREEKTDPYDTHPALAERVRCLLALPPGPTDDDDRPASVLLDRAAADAWVVDAILSAIQPKPVVRKLPWSQIHAELFDGAMRASATKAAAHLFPHFPAARTVRAMFSALARDFEARGTVPIACKLEPGLATVHPHDQLGAANEIGAELLVALFQGALLEHGAKVVPSLGARCVCLELNGTTIEAEAVAREAMSDTDARERLLRWAARFENEASLVAQPPSPPEHA